jgi:type II secretory pathway predicted ATPase ExeA
MYLRHFGLSAPPFRLTPDTSCFFTGGDRGMVLKAMIYTLIHSDGIVTLTGEVGTGKTTLSRMLMTSVTKRLSFVYIANPSIDRDELLVLMANELGLGQLAGVPRGTLSQRVQQRLIDLHSSGKQVVLLVDEAHEMPSRTLQEIRLLSNLETGAHKMMQIVLIGQPELEEKLALPELRPLRERISNRIVIPPLSDLDVARYLLFRMVHAGGKAQVFHPAAVRMIVEASHGLARRINIIAEKCLLAAYMDDSDTVRVKHVKAALTDVSFQFALTDKHLRRFRLKHLIPNATTFARLRKALRGRRRPAYRLAP